MWRILLAEDEPTTRIPIAKYLRHCGYEVVEVFDPDQAKQALREAKENDKPFSVVVLDLLMPSTNPEGGREVLCYMGENQMGDWPVILATAYGYNGPASRLREEFSNVRKVLTKTFPTARLREAIDAIVNHEALCTRMG
jgi:CheY-like chemotaxis protein